MLVSRVRLLGSLLLGPSMRRGPVRHFIPGLSSIRDKLSSSVDMSQEKKQKEFFDKLMTTCTSHPKYTIRMYLDMMKEMHTAMGGSGWRSYVAKASGQDATQQAAISGLNLDIKVLEAFPDEVKDGTALMDGKVKSLVMKTAGVGPADFNFLMKRFEAQKLFAKFFRHRHRDGLELPKTYMEAQLMYQTEASAEYMPQQKPGKRKRFGYLELVPVDEAIRRRRRPGKIVNTCEECNKLVYGEDAVTNREGKVLVVQALGLSWHPEHFFCDVCDKAILFDEKGLGFYLFGSTEDEHRALMNMTEEQADLEGYPCCIKCFEKNPRPYQRRGSNKAESGGKSVIVAAPNLKQQLKDITTHQERVEILEKERRMGGIKYSVKVIEVGGRYTLEVKDTVTKELHVVSHSESTLRECGVIAMGKSTLSLNEKEDVADKLLDLTTVVKEGGKYTVVTNLKKAVPVDSPLEPPSGSKVSVKDGLSVNTRRYSGKSAVETSDERERRLRTDVTPVNVVAKRLSMNTEKLLDKKYIQSADDEVILNKGKGNDSDMASTVDSLLASSSPSRDGGDDNVVVDKYERRKHNRRRSSNFMAEDMGGIAGESKLNIALDALKKPNDYRVPLLSHLADDVKNRRRFQNFIEDLNDKALVLKVDLLTILADYKYEVRASGKLRAAKCGEIHQKFFKDDRNQVGLSRAIYDSAKHVSTVNSMRNSNPDIYIFDDVIHYLIDGIDKGVIREYLSSYDPGSLLMSPHPPSDAETHPHHHKGSRSKTWSTEENTECEQVAYKAISDSVGALLRIMDEREKDEEFITAATKVLKLEAIAGKYRAIFDAGGVRSLLRLLKKYHHISSIQKSCYKCLYTMSKYDIVANAIENDDVYGGTAILQNIRKFGF